jgi:hypothetical protein
VTGHFIRSKWRQLVHFTSRVVGKARVALCRSTAPQAYVRPDHGWPWPSRAGAVKVGRHSALAASVDAARPHLEGGEHGGRLGVAGDHAGQLSTPPSCSASCSTFLRLARPQRPTFCQVRFNRGAVVKFQPGGFQRILPRW